MDIEEIRRLFGIAAGTCWNQPGIRFFGSKKPGNTGQ